MSKEYTPLIIPKNEYQSDLEELVKLHVDRIMINEPPFRVKKKYKHIEIPDFGNDNRARDEWAREEISRCKNGYDGLPGKFYYYFNHCKIESKTEGFIRPHFRAVDVAWFKAIEDCKGSGKGIVCIKRRQIGASWKESADVLHDCTFNNGFHVGMNSKSKDDSEMMFDNIRVIHQEVTSELRPTATATNNRERIFFAKKITDANGNPVFIGTRSSIRCVAPTPAAHAGKRYGKLVIDEAGEQSDLLSMWSKSEPCITQDTRRVGVPIIFGTVGDITGAGAGLKRMWEKNESYDFIRFAFWGYHALIIDEYGNDDIENGVRYILYERRKRDGRSRKERDEFFQMFPLYDEDAFLNVSASGVGDQLLVGQRLNKVQKEPPTKHVGYMRRNKDGGVDFVPDNDKGKIIVYEFPKPLANGYVAAADPADHDDVEKNRDTSNLALAIVKRMFGLEPPKLVLEYVDRPRKLDEFFEQSVMALQWYNNTKVLVEDNRNRMKKYFEDNGYIDLLSNTPRPSKYKFGGFEKTIGVKMNEDRKQTMMGLIADHIDNYIDTIDSERLLKEFQVFGGEHADDDLAIAFGWALTLLQADRRIAQFRNETKTDQVPNYKKMNGKIVMVNNNKPVNTLRLPNHPLLTKRY